MGEKKGCTIFSMEKNTGKKKSPLIEGIDWTSHYADFLKLIKSAYMGSAAQWTFFLNMRN